MNLALQNIRSAHIPTDYFFNVADTKTIEKYKSFIWHKTDLLDSSLITSFSQIYSSPTNRVNLNSANLK